ncbi:MAG: glycosyltransferase family 4 protein [Taibaiella sp.]|nr:glycosyltransferase family 4 protein [Taibaiella sp.]
MSADIPKRTLLVVSDTAMYDDAGNLLVFDPVLRELKVVQDMFDNIIWLGARTLNKKDTLRQVDSEKIHADMLPCVSRSGLINIFFVLLAYPVFLFRIVKYLPQATHVHTRAPSHPAFLMILLSLLDNKRIYAHKYAGEWTDKNIPLTYRIQRSLLKRVRKPNIKVIISGKNEEESVNVHDMQNPCIYAHEINAMNNIGLHKDFSKDLRLLFVGNLMPSKGVLQLLDALNNEQLNKRVTQLHIAGGGRLLDDVRKKAEQNSNVKITVSGDITREELNKLYADAHLLILPSSSESFPKVVAEAAAYGCIPVTTSLSAITRQITDGINGFLMTDNSPGSITQTINRVADNTELSVISHNAIEMSKLFTYERFRQQMARVYNINT